MHQNLQLLADVVVTGVLLGGLYGAISLGFSLCFGLVNTVNLAHPIFVVIGAYAAAGLAVIGLDPVLCGVLMAPIFGIAGYFLYRGYSAVFEARNLSPLSSMTFFFGLMFVLEVVVTLAFGVDQRFVSARLASGTVKLLNIDLPLRLLVPFILSVVMTVGVALFLRFSLAGQALLGVAQDDLAIRLLAASPTHIKAVGFAIACATAAVAGSLLIVVTPVQPSSGRDFIGRVFAIAVLGGAGSPRGALAAGVILGVVEGIVQTFAGAHWSVATGFALLLCTLALRPNGIFAR